MKKLLLSISLITIIFILSGCDIGETKTETNEELNKPTSKVISCSYENEKNDITIENNEIVKITRHKYETASDDLDESYNTLVKSGICEEHINSNQVKSCDYYKDTEKYGYNEELDITSYLDGTGITKNEPDKFISLMKNEGYTCE